MMCTRIENVARCGVDSHQKISNKKQAHCCCNRQLQIHGIECFVLLFNAYLHIRYFYLNTEISERQNHEAVRYFISQLQVVHIVDIIWRNKHIEMV